MIQAYYNRCLKKSLMLFLYVVIFMSFFLTYAKHMEHFSIIKYSLITVTLLMVFLFFGLIFHPCLKKLGCGVKITHKSHSF